MSVPSTSGSGVASEAGGVSAAAAACDDSATATGQSLSSARDQGLSSARDALADGLFHFLKPCVEKLDDNVKRTRESHINLRRTIDTLADDLRDISDCLREPVDLESYVKKLTACKRRITVINGVLQGVQDRVSKLQFAITKESNKRKVLLEAPMSDTVVDTAPTSDVDTTAAASVGGAGENTAQEISGSADGGAVKSVTSHDEKPQDTAAGDVRPGGEGDS